MLNFSKVGFEIGTGIIHTPFFPDKFHEKSPNFVAVVVFVSKIRIFETSAGTLCPPPRVRLRVNIDKI